MRKPLRGECGSTSSVPHCSIASGPEACSAKQPTSGRYGRPADAALSARCLSRRHGWRLRPTAAPAAEGRSASPGLDAVEPESVFLESILAANRIEPAIYPPLIDQGSYFTSLEWANIGVGAAYYELLLFQLIRPARFTDIFSFSFCPSWRSGKIYRGYRQAPSLNTIPSAAFW